MFNIAKWEFPTRNIHTSQQSRTEIYRGRSRSTEFGQMQRKIRISCEPLIQKHTHLRKIEYLPNDTDTAIWIIRKFWVMAEWHTRNDCANSRSSSLVWWLPNHDTKTLANELKGSRKTFCVVSDIVQLLEIYIAAQNRKFKSSPLKFSLLLGSARQHIEVNDWSRK